MRFFVERSNNTISEIKEFVVLKDNQSDIRSWCLMYPNYAAQKWEDFIREIRSRDYTLQKAYVVLMNPEGYDANNLPLDAFPLYHVSKWWTEE